MISKDIEARRTALPAGLPWVLKGTRTPVKTLFENLEAGLTIDEVIEQFPVSRNQIDGLMAFIARSLDKRHRSSDIELMRILFDNGAPRGLARFLPGHSVEEARMPMVH